MTDRGVNKGSHKKNTELIKKPPWDGMEVVEKREKWTRFRKTTKLGTYDTCFLNWEIEHWRGGVYEIANRLAKIAEEM